MPELKRYEKDKDRDERETVNVIMRNEKAPEELKLRILDAMEQREQENARKRKQNKKLFMRVASLAAVLVVAFGFTPIGGYVVHAAQEMYEHFIWEDDVFPVKMTKKKKDCTVKLVEARVGNDFLYLTTTENLPEGAEITYSGTLSDNKGHKLPFDMNNIIYCEAMHSYPGSGYEYDYTPIYDDYADSRYKIYVPAMRELINSADKKYKCQLIADVTDESGKRIARLKFKFKLNQQKLDSVLQSRELPLDYTAEMDDVTFRFEKIQYSPAGAEMFVEMTPHNGVTIDDNFGLAISVGCEAGDGVTGFTSYSLDNNYYNTYDKEHNPVYAYDGKYYLILSSDYVDFPDVDDDSEGMMALFDSKDLRLHLDMLAYKKPKNDVRYYDAITQTNGFGYFYSSKGLYDGTISFTEMEDIYIGEDNNQLSVEKIVWKLQRLTYKLTSDGTTIDGFAYIDNDSNESMEIHHMQLAAVKDGKICYTVNLSAVEPTTGFAYGSDTYTTICDNKGQRTTYQDVKDLDYDHMVLTTLDCTVDIPTKKEGDDWEEYEFHNYHLYNPNYYSLKQYKQDIANMQAAFDSLYIK